SDSESESESEESSEESGSESESEESEEEEARPSRAKKGNLSKLIKKPSKFHGKDDELIASSWIDQVEVFLDAHEVQPEDRYNVLQSYLGDDVLVWLKEDKNPRRLVANWKKFSGRFIRKYEPKH